MKYATQDVKILATWQAGVAIPALQSGVSGLLVGILGGSTALIAGVDPWKWGLLSGAAAGLGSWLFAISDWRQAIYQGSQPEPVQVYAAESRLSLAVTWDEGRAGLFDELRITDQEFISWACGVAGGRSLGENHWTGSAGLFSKGIYHQLLDRMIFHGIVRQAGRARNQGYELTKKGRAVTGAILARYGESTPPTRRSYLPE